MFEIQKPLLSDIAQMRNLIMPEVQNGIILDRSEDEMANAIRSYSIVVESSPLDSKDLDSYLCQNIESNTEPNKLDSRDLDSTSKITLINDKKHIIGFSALHIHSNTLGEVRSLIIKKDYRRKGIATKLIEHLLNEAKILGLKQILTLTYQKQVFEKLGFREIAKKSLPNHKIWADCVKCKHFPICDEIALIKTL